MQLPIVFVDSHFNRSVPEEVDFNRETVIKMFISIIFVTIKIIITISNPLITFLNTMTNILHKVEAFNRETKLLWKTSLNRQTSNQSSFFSNSRFSNYQFSERPGSGSDECNEMFAFLCVRLI